MRTLDHRLYEWLAEPDERRFARAFEAYFSVAFPAVVRHMARISRWDSALCEDLAQDALLKFFERVGRGRREACETVKSALGRFFPLPLGPFHVRQVNGWTAQVSSFHVASVSFRLSPADEADDGNWKSRIRELADRVPRLQRQGRHLLHGVCMELRWSFGEVDTADLPKLPREEVGPNGGESVSGVSQPSDAAIDGLFERLAQEFSAKTARALTAETDLPGVTQFCEGTFLIVNTLPRLRVPTNSYLFEIALSSYLDACKRRGRKKRGGMGGSASDSAVIEDGLAHPLNLPTAESATAFDGEEFYADSSVSPARAVHDSSAHHPAIDPTRQYEDEEFLEKFYEYLRKPLDQAQEAFERALTTGRAATEQRKLEAVTNKLSRTVSVLSMTGEGYTQEQTAERLGLSRNQVKYIIELVQEAYLRFATSLPPSVTTEQPHVS